MYICKIATSAARYDYFSTDLGIVFNDQGFAPSRTRLDRAKEPGRTTADNNYVILHLQKILAFQNADMMPYVTGHDEAKSSH